MPAFRRRKKKPIWIYLDVKGDDVKNDASTIPPTPSSVALSQTYVVVTPSIEPTVVEQISSSDGSSSAPRSSRESSAGPISSESDTSRESRASFSLKTTIRRRSLGFLDTIKKLMCTSKSVKLKTPNLCCRVKILG